MHISFEEIDSVIESELYRYFINVVHSLIMITEKFLGEELSLTLKKKDSIDYDYLIMAGLKVHSTTYS